MGFYLKFKPLVKSAYCQTIVGSAIDFEPELRSKTHFVRLPDNDLLSLEISTPRGWHEEKWTIAMVHGLCGSHKSHYMKRIGRKAVREGHQVVRINLRGCGSGKGLARGIYHSGCSGDVLEAIKDINHYFPKSPILLVGFSLGANVILKLSGELGKRADDHFIKGLIAVSPPADLLSSARLFTHPRNQIYAKYFLKLLMSNVNYIHSHFPDLPPHNLPPDITLNEFDELYVAPRASFANAVEYYYHSSSKRVIDKIGIPGKILFAEDDPIIHPSSLDALSIPSNVSLYKTEFGGHIGFMGKNIFREFRWMDTIVMRWIKELIR